MKKYFSIKYHHDLVNMMLRSTVLGSFSVNILTPVLLSFILVDVIDHLFLTIWIVGNLALFLFRISLIKRTVRVNNDKSVAIEEYLRWHYFVIFISALFHGAALIYSSFYVSDLQLIFISVITISLVSGSIATLGSVYHAFAIYVVFNLLPIIILFLYKGGDIFYTFSVAIFVYMFVMLKNGYAMFTSLAENIRLKETFEQRVQASTLEIEEKNSKLNESLNTFEQILNTSMIMVAFQDEKGIMTGMNQSALDVFGYTAKEEVIGISMVNFLPESSIKIVKEALQHDASKPYELMMKKKDGTEFPTLISAKYISMNSKRVRMTTMMDLTELKEKEKQLHQQSRLAQMGEMLSMIAHQWRQPLSAISATSASLTLRVKLGTLDDGFVEEKAENISSYATYLSETIDDFRNFYKPNKNRSEISLNEIFQSALSIMSVSLENHKITLTTSLNSSEKFFSYSNELKQVILNIIKNSEDILLENKTKNAKITVNAESVNGQYILKISDNGGGISKEYIDKIFDPYFSTKKKRDGTGLGLYMSKQIIEDHCGGLLKVYNDLEGAVFEIILYKEQRGE